MKKYELATLLRTAGFMIIGAGFQAVAGKTVENWIFKDEIVAKKIDDQKVLSTVTETKTNSITLNEKFTKLDEKISNYFKNDIRVSTEQKDKLVNLKEGMLDNNNKLTDLLNENPNSESITVGRKIFNNILDQGNELERILIEILSDNDKNNFISNLNPAKLSEFFDSLTLGQLAAFLNIIFFIMLLLTVYSILATLFGNEIIKYFNIEEKYPRLKTFFKLRSTFQKYYLFWNVLTLFGLCLLGIGFDIYIFYRYV